MRIGKLLVKNWSRFQHYKHRRPPWIKLHRELLENCEYNQLSDASQALLPKLWLLASETDDGTIELSLEQMCFRLRRSSEYLVAALTPLITSGFLEVAGSLEQFDSTPLARHTQDATPEESRKEPEKISSSDSDRAGAKRTGPHSASKICTQALKLAALLKAEILRNKPDYRITPQQECSWATTADRMIRLDCRTPDQIAELIRWAQQDQFWMSNVLSMDTLRKKFDQLAMKMQSQDGNRTRAATPLPRDYVPISEKLRREHIKRGKL